MPFNFKETENRLNSFWKEESVFKYNFNSSKPTFSIDTPPRYASGKMHIGHAFHYSHIDIVAKYHRLKGKEVFFPLCFDVNGMPIEVNVEKKYGIRMRDYDRQAFVKLCEEFADGNIQAMINQFESLGITADPSLYYKTSSEFYRKFTQISFIKMYSKGLIYKGTHPVNWCPRCETAIAESEIVYEDREVNLNVIRFKGNGFELLISTTRPELIPACVSIAVNPEDERYKEFVGKEVEIPLFERKVTTVTDEDVEMGFGTGVDMICSVGDRADLKMIYRHSLPFLKSIDETGRLTELAGKYSGIAVKEAQKKIIEDLKSSGHFISSSKIRQNVGTCWRCGSPLEFLQKEQWFVKSIDFKDELKKWVEGLEWHPEFMKKRMDDWIDSLSWDWVISRQRYFATPIPVWECEKGHPIVATEEQCYVDPLVEPPPVLNCPICNRELHGSTEVFDTWMDSSISPLFNTFYLRDESLFSKLYPMSLRPQGQDIIRTWAYYSLLRGNQLTGKNPWREVMVDGNIMAPDGRPMHASWGNVVDPEMLINKYGADSFRYFTAMCSLGEDTAFRERDLVRGQRFVNKIYNLINFLSFYKGKATLEGKMRPADHWIIRELNATIEQTDEAMSKYQFDRAIRTLEDFIWHKVADNYVEIIKHRIEVKRTYETIYNVLLSSLIMVSPIFPFIAEDSYQRCFRDMEGKTSIFEYLFPSAMEFSDEEAGIGGKTIEAVSLMRDLKVKAKISLSDSLSEALVFSSSPIALDDEDLKGTLRAERLSFRQEMIDEKIEGIKLSPELYSDLRQEAGAFIEFLKSNPEIMRTEIIPYNGRQIRTSQIVLTRSYAVEGKEVNCGHGFCVAVRK